MHASMSCDQRSLPQFVKVDVKTSSKFFKSIITATNISATKQNQEATLLDKSRYHGHLKSMFRAI